MTTNQIAYWKLQEDRRSNRAQEQLKSDLQEAQKKRWKVQSGTDIAKTVTSGIKDLTKAGSGIASIIGG